MRYSTFQGVGVDSVEFRAHIQQDGAAYED